jgi:hypothetical protein
MANLQAITVISKSIVNLLKDAYDREDQPGEIKSLVNAAQFVPLRPTELSALDTTQPPGISVGIVLYLYRITINTSLRNRPPRTDITTGFRYKPSLPVDLHYLLIPVATDADSQQILLAWAMRVLNDDPCLTANQLNVHQIGGEAVFAPNEGIEIVADTLVITDQNALVEPFKPKAQLAMPYVVRMILLDSPVRFNEYEPVQTRGFDFGQVTE